MSKNTTRTAEDPTETILSESALNDKHLCDYVINVATSCRHFRWVSRLGRELGLPVHLWPDKQLVGTLPTTERVWLQRWRKRQSPEPFAGRQTPDSSHHEAPPLFSWEEQATMEDYA